LDPLVRGLPNRGRHAPAMLRRPVDDRDPGGTHLTAEAASLGTGEGHREGGGALDRDRRRRLGGAAGGTASTLIGQARLAEGEGAGGAAGDDPWLVAAGGHVAGAQLAARRCVEPADRVRRLWGGEGGRRRLRPCAQRRFSPEDSDQEQG